MPVSGTELQVLKTIADRGGSTSYQTVGKLLNQSTDYARILCDSLGRADYIDLSASGRCVITPKGWQELERVGWRPRSTASR